MAILPVQAAAPPVAPLGAHYWSKSHRSGHIPRATATGPQDGVAWDPEGLLPPLGSGGGHFARREARAGQASSQPLTALAQAHGLELPAPMSAEGPLRLLCESSLAAFMPLDLDAPGLTVLHLDPPILTVDSFLSEEECEALISTAAATGELQTSAVGPGNAGAAGSDAQIAVTARRTSKTLLLQSDVLAQHPQLQQLSVTLQERAQKLLRAGGDQLWGATGRLPKPGQFCFEALQVAVYQQGQYFMAHEDAFPAEVLQRNMFQRAATVLVYLNNVEQGGATCFEHLGVSVQPVRGKALVFFPAFADGRADPRTLHTATDAHDTKWIAQQWVAWGCGAPSTVSPSMRAPVAPSKAKWLSEGDESRMRRPRKKNKGKAAQTSGSKGFGAR